MIPCSRRSTDQIKIFKVQYADSWGRIKWREKKPKREEKEEEERSGRKVGPRLNDRELGARVTGAELPAMSPPRGSQAQELGTRDAGAELRV